MRIVFCLPGRSYSGKFLNCWTALLNHCVHNRIDLMLSQYYNPNVYYVRAQCLGANVLLGPNQKPWQGKIDYDKICWIDSDMVFSVEDFEKLLSHDKDIVSGLYLTEDRVNFAAVESWDTDYFQKHGTFKFLNLNDIKNKTGLIEIAYNGFGFMMMKKGVFETITYPWFEPQKITFPSGVTDFASEDVSFCLKARQAGFKIFADPTLILGHEKMQTTLYMSMTNTIKFTEQELAEIKNLQVKFQEKVFAFGQFRLERMHLTRLVKDLETREAKADEEYAALQGQETALLQTLTQKYGEGQLNLQDGTFVPVGAPVTPSQSATP